MFQNYYGSVPPLQFYIVTVSRDTRTRVADRIDLLEIERQGNLCNIVTADRDCIDTNTILVFFPSLRYMRM